MTSSLVSVVEGVPKILGNDVHVGGMKDALDSLDTLRKRGGTHLVVTANVDHLVELSRGSALSLGYARASLLLVDGAPVKWLFRRLGAFSVDRVTGADLLISASAESRQRAWKILIVGGSKGVADEATRRLCAQYPGSMIDTVPFPMISSVEDMKSHEVIGSLRRKGADIIFLCLGAPKQELWFVQWRDSLPEGVYVGAGAAVDFAAGAKQRAPMVVQSMGAEWIWRMLQEFPRLAPRYLVKGPAFLSIIVRSLLQRGD